VVDEQVSRPCNLDHPYADLARNPGQVGRATAAWQCDDKVTPSLAEHLFVADRPSGTAMFLPVGRVLHVLDAAAVSPLAGDAIGAASIAFDHQLEPMLNVKSVELGVRKANVIEVTFAADHALILADVNLDRRTPKVPVKDRRMSCGSEISDEMKSLTLRV
jgi:hypothetical protein